jgi:hypothetical protein
MTDHNPLERAVLAAALFGGEPKTFEVGPEAAIRLADGTGHLLTDATITAWELLDVITGRCE